MPCGLALITPLCQLAGLSVDGTLPPRATSTGVDDRRRRGIASSPVEPLADLWLNESAIQS
jgi:hypothetical protein